MSRVSITEMSKTSVASWASECAALGVSGVLLSAPAVSLRGTSVPAGNGGSGFGVVSAIAVPRPRTLAPEGLPVMARAPRVEGQHGQPATKQHTYKYNDNPAANGDVAVSAAGPPHREPV